MAFTDHKKTIVVSAPTDPLSRTFLNTSEKGNVTVLESATLFQIEKRAMLRALHAEPDLSERFMASLLERTTK